MPLRQARVPDGPCSRQMSNSEVVQFASHQFSQGSTCREMAGALVKRAFNKQSGEYVTCSIIELH